MYLLSTSSEIRDLIVDPESRKKDRFCEILEYQEFQKAVPIKINDKHLEPIPRSNGRSDWGYETVCVWRCRRLL
jgi:hypothetical protein